MIIKLRYVNKKDKKVIEVSFKNLHDALIYLGALENEKIDFNLVGLYEEIF